MAQMKSTMSFKHFVEQNLPKYANVVIYAVLEWVMILLIFADGFLALLSDEFARFFELNIPCLLCTRIDYVLSRCRRSWSSSVSSYNDSMCESHKREISSLGYCGAHKKVSNVGRMCETCIVSYGKEKKEDTKEAVEMTTSCSCCGEFLKKRPVGTTGNSKCYRRNGSMNGPTPSPRVRRQHEQQLLQRSVDSPRMRFKDLKMISDSDEDYLSNIAREVIEDNNKKKSSSSEGGTLVQEDACRTPNFMRGNLNNNKFYGIPLTDSTNASPRLSRLSIENILSDLSSNVDTPTAGDQQQAAGDIVGELKRQVRLDHKSLAALYVELDEERNAAAIAANNAMAMITRLQDEKAALQMEALQYQRMMEEEVEFDQEEVELMKEMLGKREEDMKALEDELDAYRLRYGPLSDDDDQEEEQDQDEEEDEDNYQELRSNFLPSSFNVSECISPRDDHDEDDHDDEVMMMRTREKCHAGNHHLHHHHHHHFEQLISRNDDGSRLSSPPLGVGDEEEHPASRSTIQCDSIIHYS